MFYRRLDAIASQLVVRKLTQFTKGFMGAPGFLVRTTTGERIRDSDKINL
jgi:hypothetical protein